MKGYWEEGYAVSLGGECWVLKKYGTKAEDVNRWSTCVARLESAFSEPHHEAKCRR